MLRLELLLALLLTSPEESPTRHGRSWRSVRRWGHWPPSETFVLVRFFRSSRGDRSYGMVLLAELPCLDSLVVSAKLG